MANEKVFNFFNLFPKVWFGVYLWRTTHAFFGDVHCLPYFFLFNRILHKWSGFYTWPQLKKITFLSPPIIGSKLTFWAPPPPPPYLWQKKRNISILLLRPLPKDLQQRKTHMRAFSRQPPFLCQKNAGTNRILIHGNWYIYWVLLGSLGRGSNNQSGNLRWYLPLGVDPPPPPP